MLEKVNQELGRQLATLPTAATARVAVERAGFAVVCSNMQRAIKIVDDIAPEHLEVMTRDSAVVAKQLRNYGGLFIGSQSAEVMGDYGAGPNHVLPTGGTGRYTGGLSVFTFLAIRTWMELDDQDPTGMERGCVRCRNSSSGRGARRPRARRGAAPVHAQAGGGCSGGR